MLRGLEVLSLTCLLARVSAQGLTITPMFEEPVVVLEGQPLRVAFETNLEIKSGPGTSTSFVCDPQDIGTCPDMKLEVGSTDWLEFPNVTNNEHSRPENWRMRWYKGNVTDRNKAYGIELKHAAVGDHGNWTVKIASTNNEEEQRVFEVIVAKGPRDVVFEGDDYQSGSVDFDKDGDNEITDVDIECLAIECSPPPTFRWMIDDVLIYYLNDTQGLNETVKVDGREYFNASQILTLKPESWMDGRRLYCVVNHTAYNSSHSMEDRSASVTINVRAPPVPSREAVDTISEGELKSGKEGLLMVPFHANPEPDNMTWFLDDLKYPLGLNESSERYTSRGWMRYNHSYKSSNEPNQFVALLEINKLKVKDSDTVHNISIKNAKGTTMYQFRIQDIKKGRLSDGEIAGIVLGVLAGVILIALCVILIIRQRNIKKAKIQRQERRRQREEQ